MQQLQSIGQLGRSTLQNTANKFRSSSPPRSSAAGRLQVTIFEANNLAKKDESFYKNFSDVVKISQDLYCKIQVGKKTVKTTSKTNSINPKWNETFIFENVEMGDELRIGIRDDTTIGKGHAYGEVFIPLLTLKKNEDVEEWFPLRGVKRKSLSSLAEGGDENSSLLLRIHYQPDVPKFKEEKQKFIEGILNPTSLEETSSQDKGTPKSTPIRGSRSNSASSGSGDDESEKSSNSANSSMLFGISPPKFRKLSVDERNESEKRNIETEKRRQNFVTRFNLPPNEVLLGAFTAALSKQMLFHGRLYISQNYFCFYSNVFGKTLEVIKVSEIIEVKKNSFGIQITTTSNKYNFASFFFRDRAFHLLVNTWKKIGSDEEDKVEKESQGTTPSTIEEDELDDAFLSNPEEETGPFLSTSELTELVREEFPLAPVKFFKLFFSDASFTEKFRQQRGDTDIVVKDWAQNLEQGNVRELQYRVVVNQPMGPPSARVEETQRYHLTKTKLVIESISVTYDIPFGDYFRIESRWELESNNNNSSTLVICTAVHFLKRTIFKGKIESTTKNETKASFGDWVKLARSEVQRQKSLSTSKIVSSDRESEGQEKLPSSPSLSSSSGNSTVVLVKGENIVKSEKMGLSLIIGGCIGLIVVLVILFKFLSLEAIIGFSTLGLLIFYIIQTEERSKNFQLQMKSMESRIASLENLIQRNQKKSV